MGRIRLRHLAPFVLALCAASAFGGDPSDPAKAELAKARQLLAGPQEGTVRQGAQLCLKINSADSMELLMSVLEAEQPHSRDIVWECVPKFTDAYARQVVAAKLKSAGRNMPLREWCAQALGEFGVADFVGPLRMSLAATDATLRAAAARALGRIKDKSALASLKERIHDEDPFARAEAIESLARVAPGDNETRAAMWAGLHDADAGVRCALLASIPATYPELTEETASSALTDTDWRPRIQAVENLIAAKTKTAVDALVRATADGRPTVARKAVTWLQGVTGMKFTLREQWDTWWKANRATFSFPENPAGSPVDADKGRTFAAFNGLEVTSDHVTFVIDRSADMLRTLKNGKVREAAAREELEATLLSLPAGVVFDVVTYGARTQSFAKKPVPLDAKSRAAALKFVAGVPCEGRKDIWDAVSTVVKDGTIDTVYLLSSGEPEVGLYVHWNRVTEHLALLNSHYKVVFHGVSYTDSAWFREQIQKIAESTGGKFTARD